MSLADFFLIKCQHALAKAFSAGTTFSAPSLAAALTVAIAFLYLRQRHRRGRASVRAILRGLFSKRVTLSRSTFADLGLMGFNLTLLGVIFGWGLCSASIVDDFTERALNAALGPAAPSTLPTGLLSAIVTLALYLTYEFAYWLDHYFKHTIPFLWEAHKTHHSAEVLTPITQYRVHPLDSLVFANVLAVLGGAMAGLLSHVFGEVVPIFAIDGKNVVLVAFVYTTQHLQHSQVWIPFRGWLGKLLVSPAHHQLHHSSQPEHFNCNLGASLAIWDWLFGTLRIPERISPRLKFGVQERGVDAHAPTTIFLTPFARVCAELRKALFPRAARGEDSRASPNRRVRSP